MIISVNFDIVNQLLIRYSAFYRYWRKKWEYTGTVHQIFIDFEKASDSVRMEGVYSLLIEFSLSVKQ